MSKVQIYIDENDAAEKGGVFLEDQLSSMFENRTFISSEDGKFIFLTEDGIALLIQEYFE